MLDSELELTSTDAFPFATDKNHHELEAENNKLKAQLKQMKQIQAKNSNLKSEMEQLVSENRELRLKNSCLPNRHKNETNPTINHYSVLQQHVT